MIPLPVPLPAALGRGMRVRAVLEGMLGLGGGGAGGPLTTRSPPSSQPVRTITRRVRKCGCPYVGQCHRLGVQGCTMVGPFPGRARQELVRGPHEVPWPVFLLDFCCQATLAPLDIFCILPSAPLPCSFLNSLVSWSAHRTSTWLMWVMVILVLGDASSLRLALTHRCTAVGGSWCSIRDTLL